MKRSFFARGVNFCPVSSARSAAHQRQSSPLYRQRNPQSCRRQTGRGGSGRPAAIGVSILRSDFKTAGSVMFLLGIGEIPRRMDAQKNRSEIWREHVSQCQQSVETRGGDQEILTSVSDISAEDEIVVHTGNIIPFDGIVTEGEAMVNQASLTGEPLPVHKSADAYVYAGTVLEEGNWRCV